MLWVLIRMALTGSNECPQCVCFDGGRGDSNEYPQHMFLEDYRKLSFEPPHDKTNEMACAPSEDSDQPGHPPSLISVFAVRMEKAWVLSCPLSAQWRLWSDWADAQAAQSDQSLRWAHMPLCWFCRGAAHFIIIEYLPYLFERLLVFVGMQGGKRGCCLLLLCFVSL